MSDFELYDDEPKLGKGSRTVLIVAIITPLLVLGASHLIAPLIHHTGSASSLVTFSLGIISTIAFYGLLLVPGFLALLPRRPLWPIALAFLLAMPIMMMGFAAIGRVSPDWVYGKAFSDDERDFLKRSAFSALITASQSGCADLCQMLLINGMEHVTVSSGTSVVTYRHSRDRGCAAVPDTDGPLSDFTRNALFAGHCFVPQDVAISEADVHIDISRSLFQEPRTLWQDILAPYGHIREILKVTVSRIEDDQSRVQRLHRTQIVVAEPVLPLITVFRDGPVLAREDRILGGFNLEQEVLDALRLSLPVFPEEREHTETILGMLDRADSSTFSRAQHSLIADWAQFGGVPDDERSEVLLRLIRDPRVVRFDILAPLIGNQDFLEAHIETLIDQIEQRGAASNFANTVAEILGNQETEFLMPFGTTLLPVVDAGDWTRNFPLALHTGQLGSGAIDILIRRLSDPASQSLAIAASCRAAPAVGAHLVPSLMDALRDYDEGPSEQDAAIALRALARFGHLTDGKILYRNRIDAIGGSILEDPDPWRISDLEDYCEPDF